MSQVELLAELVQSEQIPPTVVPEVETGRFLRFPLGDETTGLLSLDRLVEVIKVRPKEILPIPKMPKYLLGIANRRGEAIWIVDLLYLMGDIHLSEQEIVPEVYMAMLVETEEQVLGLLVEQVSSIEVHDLANLHPFPAQTLPSRLLSFLEGYLVDSTGNTLAVLNVDTIINTVENIHEED